MDKNKTPLLLLSTDWHLEKNNTEVVKDIIAQKCNLARELGINTIFLLGDIYDSRKGQELVVLDAFLQIIELITQSYQLKVVIIPGNHDKVDYKSEVSYLASSKYIEGVTYIQKYTCLEGAFVGFKYGEVNIYLLPFFEQETWISYYNEMLKVYPLDKARKNILLTHTAFSNSINNDGTKVTDCPINYSLLKDWDLVLSGHYHDYQQPFKNTYHIPSIRQKNFGENDNKGFTLVYEDLVPVIKNCDFPKFITKEIDLSKTPFSEIKSLSEELQKQNSNVRIVLGGPIELVQAFNTQELEVLGVSVKKKNVEVEASIEYAESNGQIEELTSEKIFELFKDFCEKENLSYEEGIQYLK